MKEGQSSRYNLYRRKIMLLRGLIGLHRNSMKHVESKKDYYKELLDKATKDVNAL